MKSLTRRVARFLVRHHNAGPYVFGATVAIVVGLIVGVPAQHANRDRIHDVRKIAVEADETARRLQVEMGASRLAVCQQQRADALASIVKEDVYDATLADLFAPRPRTPALQLRVDLALAVLHNALVANTHFRDCSPAGLKAYYAPKTSPTTKGP